MRHSEISLIYKKLRYYYSNPSSLYSLSSSQTLIPPKPTSYFPCSSTFQPSFYPINAPSLLKVHSGTLLRFYSVLSNNNNNLGLITERKENKYLAFISKRKYNSNLEKLNVGYKEKYTSLKQVSEIIDLIKKDESDMEDKLNEMNVSLWGTTVAEIYRVLNCERVSGLRFFDWIKGSQSKVYGNSDVCSAVIDHCGWLDNYYAMVCLMKEFNKQNVRLDKKAFGFVPVFTSSKDLIKEFIQRLVTLLNEVGGPCRNTGIRALIEMLGSLRGSLELAKFVIGITERRTSYYNILTRELCQRCEFKEVQDLFEEMWQLGCDPDVKSYNYLLSWLYKKDKSAEASDVFKEMQEKGCSPDAITFEICIYYWSRNGKLNFAKEFLDQMVSSSIEPRMTTHAAFINGFFFSGKYEEAYNYVIDSETKFMESHMIYSLLANLHFRKGNLLIARKVLVEMMDRGLVPYFRVYARVFNGLCETGQGHLAMDLQFRFSRFKALSSTQTS